jgi:hypothetical protein
MGGVGVTLSSTNPSVGTVASPVIISQGSTYERTWFSPTYTAGTTSIKAAASGSRTMTTTGIIPAQLSVYSALPKVPATGGSYSIVVVQLQDAEGNPAQTPSGGVGISLWSSNPQVGTVSTYIGLSDGSTYSTATLYPTYTPGSTSVGASSFMLLSTLSLFVTPKTVSVGSRLTISGQLCSGVSPWTLATTITTNSAGSYSITATIPSMPKSTYDMVAVWWGSKTYKGAISEIRSFTVV